MRRRWHFHHKVSAHMKATVWALVRSTRRSSASVNSGVSTTTTSPHPLPPVERVRPGLWSVPVPIPNNPLRYVLVYAFETDDGPVLVDAGWNTDDAWAALCDGLTTAGFDVGSVRGVLV